MPVINRCRSFRFQGNTAEAPGSLSPTATYRSSTYNAGTWVGSALVCSSSVGQMGHCSLLACPSQNQSHLSCLNSTVLWEQDNPQLDTNNPEDIISTHTLHKYIHIYFFLYIYINFKY